MGRLCFLYIHYRIMYNIRYVTQRKFREILHCNRAAKVLYYTQFLSERRVLL